MHLEFLEMFLNLLMVVQSLEFFVNSLLNLEKVLKSRIYLIIWCLWPPIRGKKACLFIFLFGPESPIVRLHRLVENHAKSSSHVACINATSEYKTYSCEQFRKCGCVKTNDGVCDTHIGHESTAIGHKAMSN